MKEVSQFFKEYGKFIIGGFLVVFILVLLWNIGGAIGDGIRKLFGIEPEKGTGDFIPKPLPDNNGLTAEQNEMVRSLSGRLYQDMDGATLGITRDIEAWQQLMGLPNNMFIAVYNDFGSQYYTLGNGSLVQWIEDEWTWYDTEGIAGRSDVLARFASLNLQ